MQDGEVRISVSAGKNAAARPEDTRLAGLLVADWSGHALGVRRVKIEALKRQKAGILKETCLL